MNNPTISNNRVTASQHSLPPNYGQLYDAARALYLARRNHIEQAEKNEFKRPPEWFIEQRGVLKAFEGIGHELRIIAQNPASYDAWKASLPRKSETAR